MYCTLSQNPSVVTATGRARDTAQAVDKNEPDLVLVEPHVETIDLGVDSDSDHDSENSKDSNTVSKDKPTTSVHIKNEDKDKDKPTSSVRIKKEIEEQVEVDSDEPIVVDTTDATEDTMMDIDKTICKNKEVKSELGKVATSGTNEVVNEGNAIKKEGDTKTVGEETEAREHETVLDTIDATVSQLKHEVLEIINESQGVNESEEVNNDVIKINDSVENVDSSVEKQDEVIVLPQIMNVFGNVYEEAEKLLPLVTNNEGMKTNSKGIDVEESIEEVIKRKAIEFTTNVVKDFPIRDVDVHETPPVNAEINVGIPTELISETIKDVKMEPVNNAFGDVPMDMNFVDDGIELVDDGIEFIEDDDDLSNYTVESKPGADSNDCKKESTPDSPNFDEKLLMQPIVYSLRLDQMPAFKNTDITSVRDKTLIETALLESKPVFPRIKQEKVIEDESSLPDEHTQSNNSSDSEEDGVPDELKVKHSSYLLKKPKSRTYNPIQLCKNPDFNTRLKRLTFGFLSSMRNRSLLKTLKPMTIDVSKAFEEKLVNGTMYLKGGDGPTVKIEPASEDTSEQAISAVLPSAMPVQSLIDNTNVNIRDILQPAPVINKPPDTVLTERQRTINLPDIEDIRRINQHLLTAEVTPMRSCISTDKYKPPVQLVAAQIKEPSNLVRNEEKYSNDGVKIGNVSTDAESPVVKRRPPGIRDSAHQYLIEKNKGIEEVPPTSLSNHLSKDMESIEAQDLMSLSTGSTGRPSVLKGRKMPITERSAVWAAGYRVRPQVERLPWNKPPPIKTINHETLLTLDALQKMLNVICDSDNEATKKLKPKQLKKVLEKRRAELERVMEEYEHKIKCKDEKVDEVNSKKDESKKTTQPVTGKTGDAGPAPKKPKVNIVTGSKYGTYCCWARMKLTSDETANTRKHVCPRICTCCCRGELAKKKKWSRKPPQKPSEIVISDEDDGKKINDTIENVIKTSTQNSDSQIKRRSRRLFIYEKPVETVPRKKVDLSIQCDMVQEELEVAAEEIVTTSTRADDVIEPRTNVVQTSNVSRKSLQPIRTSAEVITLDDIDERGPIATQTLSIAPRTCVPPVANTIKNIAPKIQGHIIIDGTKKLIVRSKPDLAQFKVSTNNSAERTIYVNNKTTDRFGRPVKAPIYLGKNKILLTDVKFPREKPLAAIVPPARVEQDVTTASPMVVLPPGVQLVLLPEGILTYTVDPGVELTDEQKATLPAIITAVQEQLNASGSLPLNPLPATNASATPTVIPNNLTGAMDVGNSQQINSENTPVVDVPNDEVTTVGIAEHNTEVTQTDLIQPNDISESNVLQKENVVENVPGNDKLPDESINVGDDNGNPTSDGIISEPPQLLCSESITDVVAHIQNNDIDSDNPISTTNIDETNLQNTVSPEKAQENVVETQKETTDLAATSNRKSLLSDLMEMSGIWDDIDTNVPANNESTSQSLLIPPADPPVLPVAQPMVTPDISAPNKPTSPIAELTPISSYSQLKYACEQNGNFFKLDLETGTMSCGIKVCIKKQLPKSVIDLTEDDDVAEAHITQEPAKESPTKSTVTYTLPHSVSRSLLRFQNPGMTANDPVKPIKLFRSVRILKKNKEHTVLLPAIVESAPANSGKRTRKQSLNEVRNDDKPVEIDDEDSLDSGSLDQYIYRDSDFLDSSLDTDGDDSSDDEPLATKAKRMRMTETNDTVPNNEQSVVQNSVESTEGQVSLGDVEEGNQNDFVAEAMDDGNDDLSDNMVRELPEDLMAFMPDNIDDDDDDDDCILGV